MSNDDISYFLKRAEEESSFAQKSHDPTAAKVHYELATLYRERAAGQAPHMRWRRRAR